ncbi:UNVERIFIED_CONTAM: preprotein translocase subunit YajC [Williamsia faeni]
MELLFPLLLVFLVGMMFLSIRRQKKASAEAKTMQESLQVGVRVQTTSGVYGTVTGLAEGTVDIEIADGLVSRWNRLAIREVVLSEDLADSYPGVGLIGDDVEIEYNGIHDDDDDLGGSSDGDDTSISLEKPHEDQDKA